MTFEASPARKGLDWLLAYMPHLELVDADWQRPEGVTGGGAGGPWLLVTLGQLSDEGGDVFALHPYAIWKRTGAVHGMRDGAVVDPPLFVP